ncbi:pyroglutamyl-peptidase I [Brevibacterium litoralis]|uniref:pyroglutamyl-peptidase I family protein n=1 Tax=Brevibacterium litoralis TaxID=3138935 RepID=UPI0032ECFA33
MRILLSSFEPFGGDPENASAESVRLLLDRAPSLVGEVSAAAGRALAAGDLELVGVTLPVSLDAWSVLQSAVAAHDPDLVLAVGEAGARVAITPEVRGVNEDDFRIPDNAGNQPRGTAIEDGGPAERHSDLDVDGLVAAIREAGLPAASSADAGRFLCNHLAYRVPSLPVPGGFVHVPAVRSRGVAGVGAETDPGEGVSGTGGPSTDLTFEDLALALAACVAHLYTRAAEPTG